MKAIGLELKSERRLLGVVLYTCNSSAWKVKDWGVQIPEAT